MPIATATSTALDLSALPAPDVVTQLPFLAIRAEIVADLQARWPEFSAVVASDPIMKLIDVVAYREMIIRQEFNARAKGVLIAHATGNDLDNIGALFNLDRLVIAPANVVTGTLAVMEGDDDFRRRIILAPDGWAVAGPASAYVYHALSAHPDIADASAWSPAPGEVLVSVLSRIGNGTPSLAEIAAVTAVVTHDEIRPLTDQVTVQAADVLIYSIVAALTLFSGPDAPTIMAAARAALDAFCLKSRRLGRDIPLSALIGALHVEGVKKVVITAPLADIICSPAQAPHNDAITLTLAGYD